MLSLTDRRRRVKKSIIAAIYLFLWVGFFTTAWAFFGPPAPTCYDNIRNGNERGVDCGGGCQRTCELDTLAPLTVEDVAFLPITAGKGDLVAVLKNTNAAAGARYVHYKFSLFDSGDNLIKTISDTTRDSELIYTDDIYIMPQATRPIIHPAVSVPGVVARVAFEASVARSDWQFGATVEPPQIFVKPHPEGIAYNPPGAFLEYRSLIQNNSALEFRVANVDAVVRDNAGKIIAVSRAEIRNLRPGEERGHPFTWYVPVAGLEAVSNRNFSFFATTNIYIASNVVQPEASLGRFR